MGGRELYQMLDQQGIQKLFHIHLCRYINFNYLILMFQQHVFMLELVLQLKQESKDRHHFHHSHIHLRILFLLVLGYNFHFQYFHIQHRMLLVGEHILHRCLRCIHEHKYMIHHLKYRVRLHHWDIQSGICGYLL